MVKDAKKKAQPKAAAKKPAKAKPGAKKQVLKQAKPAALPLPAALVPSTAKAKLRKTVLQAESRHLLPLDGPATGSSDVLDRLWNTIEGRRVAGDATISHSARLLARGTAKVAQKLGEEAVECVIEATQGNRAATVLESADLLYHLLVVWVDAGIRPEEVWAELVRREGISGIAEKAARPKGIVRAAQTTKIP
ncbi:MAG: phosphoribosyl-ATP diphosphatase [Roseomonas sp.]|jgi:phosphoribosyl-ATP pyrophosphohydrolase|nr:phosphoribosyl-ATP diphosphatase [Roseomonas sp.]